MKRKTAALLLGAALVAARRPARAQNVATLHIISPADDDVTPVLYAQQSGLFQAAGLDVAVTVSSSGSAVVVAIIGGAANIGKATILPVINAHVHGVPLTIVAPAAYFDPHELLAPFVLAKDSPVHRASDLTGKTVAVPGLNDVAWLSAKAWIDKNGGSSSTVNFVEIPSSAVPSAIDAGRIDAGFMLDPGLSAALASGKYRTLGNLPEGIAPRFLASAWIANSEYVEKNPDTFERFMSALHQAAIYCNGHHAQTVDILAKFAGIDPQVVAKMGRVTYAPTLIPRDVQPLIDAAAKYKIIPSAFDAKEMISPLALRRTQVSWGPSV